MLVRLLACLLGKTRSVVEDLGEEEDEEKNRSNEYLEPAFALRIVQLQMFVADTRKKRNGTVYFSFSCTNLNSQKVFAVVTEILGF